MCHYGYHRVYPSSALQLGAVPPPQLSFLGQPLRLVSSLGVGATSSVYKCVVELDGEEEECAAKVLQGSFSADLELQVLEELRAGGCDGIPVSLGRLQSPSQGFLLRPLGTTLAAGNASLQHPQLFKAIRPLLQALQKAHRLGYVHRDLRLPNLLVVETSAASVRSRPSAQVGPAPGSLVILDWWALRVVVPLDLGE